MNGEAISLAGTGLVIGARTRWDALPLSDEVRFVDRRGLAALRAEHPTWRSISLAPVDIVDDAGTLAAIEDASIDYVVDWSALSDADPALDRLGAAARVLRPGGLLVLPAYDSRFIGTDCDERYSFAGLSRLARSPALRAAATAAGSEDDRDWPFGRFSTVISAFATIHAQAFELEQLRRYGYFNLASLRRRNDRATGFRGLIICGLHSYALDGPFLRHITSVGAFNKLRAAMLPTIEIGKDEQALFVAGLPLGDSDVAEFLAKTDMTL